MNNKKINEILGLLNSDEMTVDEILAENPELKETNKKLLARVNALIKNIKTEEEMPWIKSANVKREKFELAKIAIKGEVEKIKEIAKRLASGIGNTDDIRMAQQYFRERDLTNLSEEEIVELLTDQDLIDRLKDE